MTNNILKLRKWNVSFLVGGLALALFFSSCHLFSNKPDVSNIDVKIKVFRFEQDMHKAESLNYDAWLNMMNTKYPDFFPFYLKAVAQLISPLDTTIGKDTLVHYLHDPYVKVLYDSTEKKYSNISDIENELTEAFKYYHYYFPHKPIPDIITYIDGPPYGLTFQDNNNNILGIGLDGYLGERFPAYTLRPDPVPLFALRKFRKEYIVPNTMNVLATGVYDFNMNEHKMIDAMVYKGKVLYFVKKMLPDTPDSLIFGYADSTLTWLNMNERNVWHFFITNKLLYETDPLIFSKYINDAPSTSGMPPEAPGNVACWVGYKIVEEYMKSKSGVTLEQLMNNTDAQKILEDSEYKP